jgi:fimbrial chaperone protein
MVLAVAFASAANATTIAPVIIDEPSSGRAIVTVRNDAAREVLYQIAVMDWHVVNGADRYADTQDFVASPPLFTLAPSASQIVRIGFRNPAPQPVERAYRLVLAEVPRPGDTSSDAGVVNFAMQYLLPVFVASASRGAKPPLTWSARVDDDEIILRADNPGTSRTALNMVGLSTQPGASPEVEFASRQRVTVLAHSWREWRFPVHADKQALPWRIVVLNSGSDDAVVVPDADMRPATSR